MFTVNSLLKDISMSIFNLICLIQISSLIFYDQNHNSLFFFLPPTLLLAIKFSLIFEACNHLCSGKAGTLHLTCLVVNLTDVSSLTQPHRVQGPAAQGRVCHMHNLCFWTKVLLGITGSPLITWAGQPRSTFPLSLPCETTAASKHPMFLFSSFRLWKNPPGGALAAPPAPGL